MALFVFAVTRTGRSTESVDVRTYVEMTHSIAKNGVPFFDNGPVGDFIALRSPFNLYTRGHLWGIYGPVYPYYAALPYKIGGFRLASVATCFLLIPLALVTFFLTRRLLARRGDDEEDNEEASERRDEWYATAAAILVVLSTPALGKSLELSAYPLAMVFAAGAASAVLEASTSRGRRRFAWSVAAGALFALGSGTHLLCLPMSMALLGALGLCDAAPASARAGAAAHADGARRGPAWIEHTVLRALWPTRATITSAAAALFTMILLTLPVAYLNHVRFGAWNPFSYGPVPWAGMQYLGAQDQTISAHVKAAMPVIAVAGWLFVGWLVGSSVRHRWEVRAVVLTVAAIALMLSSPLAEKSWIYAKATYAFTIDQSFVDMPLPYRRLPGMFANLHGPWVTKSPLECTPLLIVALFLPALGARAKQMAFVVLAPAAALVAYLALRGNLPLYSALGVPWVYIRYTMPALPMMIAAAMLVARDVGLGRREWILAALIGGGLTFALWCEWGDETLHRQILVVALPLGIAAICAVTLLVQRSKRVGRSAAAIAIAAACGVGIGIGGGHDLRAHVEGKRWCDQRADAMRRAVPQRFALFGKHPTLDPVLAVTLERDAQYADIAEGDQRVDEWLHVRPLVEHWFREKRPVYFAANDKDHHIPWKDMNEEIVDQDELIYLITPKVVVSSPSP